MLYNKWIDMYKKEYEHVFESKDKDWRKKHDYKNLKNFSYQIDEVKKDEADKNLLPWIKVTKTRFNDEFTKNYESRLMS